MILDDESQILGIDEAGRGSVIGPLVIGGVLMKKKKIRFLNRIGVKDSKQLNMKKRTIISRKIKKIAQFKTIIIPAHTIDEKRNNDINLNEIETEGMEEIIRQEYGSVGSGYPSDKNTINYLKTIKNNQFPPIIRKTWKTIENITKSTE